MKFFFPFGGGGAQVPQYLEADPSQEWKIQDLVRDLRVRS